MGRLTRDAEVRYSQNGQEQKAVARYTLAVDRKFNKDGQQSADFIGCVSFGKTAEFIEKYGKKGTKFVVEGRIQTGSYNKDGQRIYTTDVVVESAEFAESKSNGTAPQPQPQPDADGFVTIPDDIEDGELPFV